MVTFHVGIPTDWLQVGRNCLGVRLSASGSDTQVVC